MTNSQPFSVDLRGVVSLLSRNIYSGPKVYLRELIQNGIDAIKAREDFFVVSQDVQLPARPPKLGIRIRPATNNQSFRITDEGIGLTLSEVKELLAKVGSSSKRDLLDLPSSGFLGHFGIGMLSCFMITDEIIVTTKSIKAKNAVIWHGFSNGTFSVSELNETESLDIPFGTSVEFTPRADDRSLASPNAVDKLSRLFAQYTATKIEILLNEDWVRINKNPIFTKPHSELSSLEEQELMEIGTELCGSQPISAFEIRVPGTDLAGTGFLLSHPQPPNYSISHTGYLGGLYISDKLEEVAPDWAFFVRCIFNTTALTPTASRESLVKDATLDLIREAIGISINQHLNDLAISNPEKMGQFVNTHNLGLWSVSVYDDRLAQIIAPWLPVLTNQGMFLIRDFLEREIPIRYCPTDREFQAIASLNLAGDPIVNAGHTYEIPLLNKLPKLFSGAKVQKVTLGDLLSRLGQPEIDEFPDTERLRILANESLKALNVATEVRLYEPIDTLGFVIPEHRYTSNISLGVSNWGGIVSKLSNQSDPLKKNMQSNRALLCLNWSSPLVKSLSKIKDEVVANRIIRVIYLQSVLSSARPLRSDERKLANDALNDLILLSQFEVQDFQ